MRFKLTVFLIVANLITFGLIFFESSRDPADVRVEQSIFSAGITKIVVSGKGTGETFSLELDNKEWFIVSPFRWIANPFEVNRILNELRFLDIGGGFSVKEAISTGNTLANYGLETPRVTVNVTDDSGTRALKIGNATPDGHSVYVMTPDSNRIIPAPLSLLENLSKNPAAFRVKEVFSIRPYEVQSITERIVFKVGDEQRIGFVRQKEESALGNKTSRYVWKFETPILTDADTQKIEELLSELSKMNYVRFIPSDLALLEQSGLKSPWLRFVLEGARRSQTLLVGNPDPSDKTGETLFAKLENNDAIFTVPADVFRLWRNPLENLRDPFFFKFEPELLSAITISDDGNDVLLLRRNDSVRVGEKENLPPAETVPSLLAGDEKPAAETPLAGAVLPPLGQTRRTAPVYANWQMPVAPSSRVTSITSVEPEQLRDFVEKIRNLKAVNFPLGDESLSQARKNLRKAFVTDSATEEDVVAMNFRNPVRKIEFQFRDSRDTQAKTFVKTIAIAEPTETDSPYHAKCDNAIYSIDPSVMDVISTDPKFFAARRIYALPEGAQIVSLKLSDISETPEKIVFDEKKSASVADLQKTLADAKDKRSAAIASLALSVADFSAAKFMPGKFSTDYSFDYQNSGAPETWRYRLEIDVRPAGGNKTTPPQKLVFYFTKRLGGTFQLCGSPEKGTVFSLRQDMIDALHELTFAIDPSKDIPEIPVPAAVPPQQ